MPFGTHKLHKASDNLKIWQQFKENRLIWAQATSINLSEKPGLKHCQSSC